MKYQNGFVYEWINKITGQYYIGSHRGVTTDGYIGSGVIFTKAVKKHGIENFDRIIHYEGPDYREKEASLLKERDAKNDPLSYNLKNDALGAALIGEENGMYGKKHTKKSLSKMANTLSTGERWGSEEKKIAQAAKMSGENNPMYGSKRKGTWAIEKGMQTKKIKGLNWSHLSTEKHHRAPFLALLKQLASRGNICAPRDMKIVELENFVYKLPPYVRFCNFEIRKLNMKYIKTEFLWYLRGDRFDTSICSHAKMWQGLVQPDGGINSNYGQYIFNQACNQFGRMVDILTKDKDSRRAAIVILNKDHVLSETTDQPCTYSLRFSIRENKLNMTVHMRSQDGIFGMGNDAPCFSFIHEMLFMKLKDIYSDLEYGEYTHIADSFHVYERHFSMLKELTNIDPSCDKIGSFRRVLTDTHRPSYKMVLCPKISSGAEVDFLIKGDFSNIPENFLFTKWLLEE